MSNLQHRRFRRSIFRTVSRFRDYAKKNRKERARSIVPADRPEADENRHGVATLFMRAGFHRLEITREGY